MHDITQWLQQTGQPCVYSTHLQSWGAQIVSTPSPGLTHWSVAFTPLAIACAGVVSQQPESCPVLIARRPDYFAFTCRGDCLPFAVPPDPSRRTKLCCLCLCVSVSRHPHSLSGYVMTVTKTNTMNWKSYWFRNLPFSCETGGSDGDCREWQYDGLQACQQEVITAE